MGSPQRVTHTVAKRYTPRHLSSPIGRRHQNRRIFGFERSFAFEPMGMKKVWRSSAVFLVRVRPYRRFANCQTRRYFINCSTWSGFFSREMEPRIQEVRRPHRHRTILLAGRKADQPGVFSPDGHEVTMREISRSVECAGHTSACPTSRRKSKAAGDRTPTLNDDTAKSPHRRVWFEHKG